MYCKFANLEKILKKLANEEVIPPNVFLPPGFDIEKPMDDRARFTFKLFMLHQHYKEGNYTAEEYKKTLKAFNKEYHKRNHEEWAQRASITKSIGFPIKNDDRQKAWVDGVAHVFFGDETNYIAPMYGQINDHPLLMHYISGVKFAESKGKMPSGLHNEPLGQLYLVNENIQAAISKYGIALTGNVRDYIISKLFRRINANNINMTDLAEDMGDRKFMTFLCVMCGLDLPKYIEKYLSQRINEVTSQTLANEFNYVKYIIKLMNYLDNGDFKSLGYAQKVNLIVSNYKSMLEKKFPVKRFFT